ncbi:hypothetical protein [Pseudomonas piscis]|uniref:hypothetical protein n=1 Tax=Pseudomonas piscis TaxID=2614538 RepID=UPI0021D5E370|nr:hypothetical protein [Pseudomonas piscis]MCU7646033.1 hypothetical protein [Pseudomonas piscis]
MLISSASPQALVDWFHTRQTEQRLLCVMLAPSDADQQKLASLIANLDEADSAMGRKVAFILLDPTTDNTLGILEQPGGNVVAFPGRASPSLQPGNQPIRALRDEQTFRDLGPGWEDLRKRMARNSSKATAQFVPAFAELFAISPSEQPCLCVLVKGLDKSVVLPLGSDWSTTSLLALMTQLHEIANRTPDFRSAYQQLEIGDLRSALPPMQKALEEIDESISTLTQVLEKLLSRYQGTDSDRHMVASFIADQCPGTNRLLQIFNELSFNADPDFQEDPQALRAEKLMAQIGKIRNRIRNDRQRRETALSLADQAQMIVESRKQLFISLNELRPLREVSTSTINIQLLGGLKNQLEWIDLVGNTQEKVVSAVEWCLKLFSK